MTINDRQNILVHVGEGALEHDPLCATAGTTGALKQREELPRDTTDQELAVGDSQGAADVLMCCEAADDSPQLEFEASDGECAVADGIAIGHLSVAACHTSRPLPTIKGTYIRGKIQGLDVILTVDQGCENTMVSHKVYQQIPAIRRPRLWNKGLAEGAGGALINVWGWAPFELKFGSVKLTRVLAVAEIQHELLLGHDLLARDPAGPMDVLNSTKELLFQGQRVPLVTVGEPSRSIRVLSVNDHVIPGMTEMVIDGYVERPVEEVGQERCMLVEGNPEFCERYECVICPTLVNVSGRCSTHVRVLNPFPDPRVIPGNVFLGTLEHVQQGKVVKEQEYPEEQGNPTSLRRVQLRTGPSLGDSAQLRDKASTCDEWTPRVGKSLGSSVRQVQLPMSDSTAMMQLEGGLSAAVVSADVDVGNTLLPEHLKELYERAREGWTVEQQDAIRQLLCKYPSVFAKDEYDLGLTDLVEHEIPTGDAAPIKLPPRRVPLAFVADEKREIEKMLQQGIARPSTSPWAAPLVLVRKPDGSARVTVDFRELNRVTRDNAYPLPRTEDCLDALSGACVFSVGDGLSAYHQVPMKESDIPKTAFVTKFGLFEHTTMPMGLKCAPATFQRLMELALSGLVWQTCLIYLDDCIVFGKSFDEQLVRLEEVLQRFQKAGLKLKPSKCNFFQREVRFLGHLVSAEGIQPDPANVQKIKDWPKPRCVTDIRVVLGMGGYYRRFIKDYSKRMQPLINLTKERVPFFWTEDCQAAFDDLKEALMNPPLLAHPTPDGHFILDTDASKTTVGAVLTQIQDGVEHPISYGSRTLSTAERNYCATDRELLAGRYFMEYYKHYLLGRTFTLRTDHDSLRWLFSLREPKERVARWIETMSCYQFRVEYRPGHKHGNADAMSRICANPQDCDCPLLVDNLTLKCGPCKKCCKRAESMDSSLLDSDGNIRAQQAPMPTVAEGIRAVQMIRRKVGRTGRRRGATSCLGTVTVRHVVESVPDSGGGQKDQGTTAEASRGSTWALPYTMKTLREKQLKDPDIAPLMIWKEQGKRPMGREVLSASPATRHYWLYWDALSVTDGVLFRKFIRRDGSGEHQQFVVPRQLRELILYHLHDGRLSGHLGKPKTKERLLQRFYWYGVREDVDLWVDKCETCASVKKPTQTIKAPLGEMPVGAPLDRMATDILGPLPVTPRGNRFILVVTDAFTKWVEIFPIPDQTAPTCARVILNEVIARFGSPLELLSDQGPNYESILFKELCHMLEIRKIRTSPGNPRCNGQTERFNRTLLKMIKSYLRGEERDWDLHLPCLAAAYRSTPHDSTGLTPNLLMLGREVRIPMEVVYGGQKHEASKTYGAYVERLKKLMQHAHDIARENLGVAAKRQKDLYDAKAKMTPYTIGDLVWMETDVGQLDITPKLRVPYEGPFMVWRRVGPLDYELYLDRRKKKVVHYNRLKPYRGLRRPRGYYSALAEAKRLASLT